MHFTDSTPQSDTDATESSGNDNGNEVSICLYNMWVHIYYELFIILFILM